MGKYVKTLLQACAILVLKHLRMIVKILLTFVSLAVVLVRQMVYAKQEHLKEIVLILEVYLRMILHAMFRNAKKDVV
jgi:hypothetical protein